MMPRSDHLLTVFSCTLRISAACLVVNNLGTATLICAIITTLPASTINVTELTVFCQDEVTWKFEMINTTYTPIEWFGDSIKILDQTLLPFEETYLQISDYREMVTAINLLRVRGAPLIGVSAAYGIALGALKIDYSKRNCWDELNEVVGAIRSTRPTARNLFMAVERMENIIDRERQPAILKQALVSEAASIHNEEIEYSRLISQYGSKLIIDNDTILTHCNAGPLATAGYGTALGIVIQAFFDGKKLEVLVDETRPLLQGSRLTAWELKKNNIPFKLITDSMAGYFMKQGKVNAVIVGADRIAANGDTANKIGTYSLSVLAKAHGIPFYFAAPTSTIDMNTNSGMEIVIEERKPEEITNIRGIRIAPENIAVANPAFDITPQKYITAIVTERGIIKRPFRQNIAALFNG
jgi:methylthioribose-1-phosphate isomerase